MTLRSMIVAAGVALCVAAIGGPADARDRATQPPSPHPQQGAPASTASVSEATRPSSPHGGDGRFERQCVIMECGTPWCYNVRVN